MSDPGRILSLDAMRGFAVMGILLMNIIAFAMPDMAYVNPRLWGGQTPAAYAVWTINFILVDGKMRGLFSLLFGASTLLIWKGAMARGEGPARLYHRFFWLFVLGLIHYVFIWWGDILRLYALAGPFLLLFVRRKPMDLMKAAILCFLIQFVLLAIFAVILAMAGEGALSGTDTAALLREVTLYRDGYGSLVQNRLTRMKDDQLALLAYSGFEALGFMLMGMAMLKTGFLTGAWPIRRYLRLAARCYIAGLLPMLALAAWCWGSHFDLLVTFNAGVSWSFPFRMILTLAHAALLMALVKGFGASGLMQRIAAAGRTAFTNYVGTSLLMTTIFYGYGLGLYGAVDRVTVYLFVVAAWVLMLAWPLPWLNRFRYGPFEWVWRSLTLRRWEPLRRN